MEKKVSNVKIIIVTSLILSFLTISNGNLTNVTLTKFIPLTVISPKYLLSLTNFIQIYCKLELNISLI